MSEAEITHRGIQFVAHYQTHSYTDDPEVTAICFKGSSMDLYDVLSESAKETIIEGVREKDRCDRIERREAMRENDKANADAAK